MKSAIYSGFVTHTRHIPKRHSFSYPFFMWFLDLETIAAGADLGRWFSSRRRAISRFRRSDYLGAPERPLAECVAEKMAEITGTPVTGRLFGLVNVSTLGLYFSPVNFYYGYTDDGELSHLLAEVANTPWNERHHYAHLLSGTEGRADGDKTFKVSPFNPSGDQKYRWTIGVPADTLALNLGVFDGRGHVFEAALRLERRPFTAASARKHILRIPVMTAYIVANIYWQALKLYLKGIPYIPYDRSKHEKYSHHPTG